MIAVIVVLAVLGVVALPRFLSVTDSSHQANIQGLKTQYQEAIHFAHIRWALNGRALTEMNDLPGYGLDENGQPQLDINDEGYPLGTNKNNPMGAPYNIGRGHNGCVDIWEALVGRDACDDKPKQFDGFDFVARRQNLHLRQRRQHSNSAAVCYYIYTKRG